MWSGWGGRSSIPSRDGGAGGDVYTMFALWRDVEVKATEDKLHELTTRAKLDEWEGSYNTLL
jgi:hypothetical protein